MIKRISLLKTDSNKKETLEPAPDRLSGGALLFHEILWQMKYKET